MMREWKCIITNPITGKLGEGVGRAIRHQKEAREASARSQRREGWTRRRRSFRRDAPPCPALTAPNPLTCTESKKMFLFFVCGGFRETALRNHGGIRKGLDWEMKSEVGFENEGSWCSTDTTRGGRSNDFKTKVFVSFPNKLLVYSMFCIKY